MLNTVDIQLLSKDLLKNLSIFQDAKEDVYTSFVSGSLFEGFGNKLSDVDIFILCNKLPEKEDIKFKGTEYDYEAFIDSGENLLLNIQINKISFDIEFWDMEKIDNKLLEFFKGKHNPGYVPNLSKDEYDLFHRFKHGVPLFNNENFNSLREKVDFRILGNNLIDESTRFYLVLMTDVQGAYASEDFVSSYFMARILLETVLPAYLVLKGETNPKPKWLYRKVLRYSQETDNPEFLNKYLSFYNVDLTCVDNTKNKIREIMAFCQQLNIEIQHACLEANINE
ncbi:hypothetical protein [Bacillus cereus group sp. BfR-BA-01518]|uniref:hypothetical protein n=1 Tax=Bacillus cereus group sp. BfR-BA-01518 TaxID=2920368 RepID=UPI001F5AC576|nr:hypothetical protein [Bacillus cereus group sp. BfR-BA-01518]